jgi:membrane AbrB-like protein
MGTAINGLTGVGLYLLVGTVGGLIGSRMKVTGGTLLGAMLAVILLKVMVQREFDIPKGYAFIVQVLIGIMVGASYTQEMNGLFARIALPVVISTLVLVAAGLIISLVLVRTGLLDASTAYLSTSPGAMSAMISLAGEGQANSPVVLLFHFFRIALIILTAPVVFRLIQLWLGRPPG